MKKRNIPRILLLLLPLCLTHCTKEDYRNCPGGMYILFAPQNSKHILSDQGQRVSLYFYDTETDSLVERFHYLREELQIVDQAGVSYLAAFVPQLADGTYRMLAMVNGGFPGTKQFDDQYTESEQYERFSTVHTRLLDEMLDYKPIPFFSGEKTLSVAVNTASVVPTHLLTLAKHTNNIHLHIVYDEYEPWPSTNIEAYIDGANRRFDYAAYACDSTQRLVSRPWERRINPPGHYLPDHPAGFSLTTMRLWRGGDITLHIDETGGTRADDDLFKHHIDLNLAEILSQVKHNDGNHPYDTDAELEFNDEYNIGITLGRNFTLLGVRINNWDVVTGEVDI
jgi:hypothetical protein